jgi:hypothetical protein
MTASFLEYSPAGKTLPGLFAAWLAAWQAHIETELTA